MMGHLPAVTCPLPDTSRPLADSAGHGLTAKDGPRTCPATPGGPMAEWLRRGLQILARRFDSGSGLQAYCQSTEAADGR